MWGEVAPRGLDWFGLSGEEGGCTAFDGSGLVVAETGYVGGNKIFGGDLVGCWARLLRIMEWCGRGEGCLRRVSGSGGDSDDKKGERG